MIIFKILLLIMAVIPLALLAKTLLMNLMDEVLSSTSRGRKGESAKDERR